MASPLVQKFRNDTAPRLLAKFANGGTLSVIRAITPNPDPLLPPTEVVTTAPINAYVSGVPASILTSDANLVASDLQVIVAALDYTPSVGNHVEIDGINKAIISIRAIPAAGPPAAYRFFVR